MARLAVPLCVCALLAVSALPHSAESDPLDAGSMAAATVGSIALADVQASVCAEANSDYERSDLGCPIEEAHGSAAFND